MGFTGEHLALNKEVHAGEYESLKQLFSEKNISPISHCISTRVHIRLSPPLACKSHYGFKHFKIFRKPSALSKTNTYKTNTYSKNT